MRVLNYLRRFMRVLLPNLEAEGELAVSVEALVRVYHELKVEEVVLVRELSLAGLGQLQLVYILNEVVNSVKSGNCFIH